MANGIFCSKAGVGTDRNDVLSELYEPLRQ